MSPARDDVVFAIADAELEGFRLRLRRPLVTSRGAMASRDGVILRLIDADGHRGHGEACPLPGFAPRDVESADGCARALRFARDLDSEARSLASWIELGRDRLVELPCALAAFEGALVDIAARRAGRPLAAWLAGDAHEPRSRVEVNALIAGEADVDVARAAERAADLGHRTFKLKLRDDGRDPARVRALRAAVGAGAAIRLDANGAWSPKRARSQLEELASLGIEYVEQPLPPGDLEALACLREGSPVAIAADEDAADLASAEAVIAQRAADWIVLKPSLCGGVMTALEIARRARAAGIGVVVTSALESAVGRAAALHLAAALDPPPPASGLATGSWLERDLAELGEPVGGSLRVPTRPGIGIEPAPDLGSARGDRIVSWT